MMRNFEENSPSSQGGGKIFNPFDNTQGNVTLGGNGIGFSDFDGDFLGQGKITVKKQTLLGKG